MAHIVRATIEKKKKTLNNVQITVIIEIFGFCNFE